MLRSVYTPPNIWILAVLYCGTFWGCVGQLSPKTSSYPQICGGLSTTWGNPMPVEPELRGWLEQEKLAAARNDGVQPK
jgi:hypothetical protein